MLGKGAICQTSHLKEEFLSNVFLVGKKGGEYRPVINLKHLNQFIPYQHFKLEDLFCLREMLQKDDFICKLDMKDAYFSVPLHQSTRKYVRFFWSGNLYKLLCLCFVLGPAPRIFTKFLKVPKLALRQINVQVIIYLDDMPLIGQTMEDILMSKDTTIFLLQHFEHGEINFEFRWRDRISWSDIKLCENDTFIPRTKNKTNSESMSRTVCESFCHGLGADKTYRSFSFNNLDCITDIIILSISSATTDKCSKAQWVIPKGPVFEQGVKERTTVVDSKLETLQWYVDNTTSVLCYNKSRCLQEGLGCIFRRGMDIRGKGNAHKYFGTEASEISFNVISETNENERSSFSNQQCNSLDVLTKNGGTGNKKLLDWPRIYGIMYWGMGSRLQQNICHVA